MTRVVRDSECRVIMILTSVLTRDNTVTPAIDIYIDNQLKYNTELKIYKKIF